MFHWILLFWTLAICTPVFCQPNPKTNSFVAYFNGTFGSNAPTIVTSLSQFYVTAMRYEFDLKFEFPVSACCPSLSIVYGIWPHDPPCFNETQWQVTKEENPNLSFTLTPGPSGSGALHCQYSNNRTWITCSGKASLLYPSMRKCSILQLGYDCATTGKSLEGFIYNVKGTFSNSTLCDPVNIPECPHIKYTAFPNTFGDKDLIDVKKYLNLLPLVVNGNPPCYEPTAARKLICSALFYKCPNEERQTELIMPCVQSCEDIVKACAKDIKKFPVPGILKKLPFLNCSSYLTPGKYNCELYEAKCPALSTVNNGFIVASKNQTHYPAQSELYFDCNDGFKLDGTNKSTCKPGGYWDPLPTCKQVTCSIPQRIKNGFIQGIQNITSFSAYSEITIECNDGFVREGNNKSLCRNDGQWTKFPTCKKISKSSNTITIVASVLSCIVIICVLAAGYLIIRIRKYRKRDNTLLDMEYYGTRDKKYDVFVSYFDDGRYEEHPQKDFVWNIVLPFLEETCDPPFKVLVHPRDFLAGNLIKENIIYGIQNSNALLAMMSPEYAASHWCKDEFEEAIFEHRKDPAFRILVVLLQPVDSLGELSPYLQSFLQNRTYLSIDDAEIWPKIRNILQGIRDSLADADNSV